METGISAGPVMILVGVLVSCAVQHVAKSQAALRTTSSPVLPEVEAALCPAHSFPFISYPT